MRLQMSNVSVFEVPRQVQNISYKLAPLSADVTIMKGSMLEGIIKWGESSASVSSTPVSEHCDSVGAFAHVISLTVRTSGCLPIKGGKAHNNYGT
jgi:hypothetical protein